LDAIGRHKRLLTSMAKSLARNIPRGLGLNPLLAAFERALSAACQAFLFIFSACCELVDNAVGIGLAGIKAALGKIRVVRSVGEFLWFQAESGARTEG
jgi:hypothetical protein